MNAGKSTAQLQASRNHRARGLATLLCTAASDAECEARVHSRIGIGGAAREFDAGSDRYAEIAAAHRARPLGCVLVDEAQFLGAVRVRELARLVDLLELPVPCYGLRTGF